MTTDSSRFSGSIPALYDRYLGPMLFEPYARELAARLDVPADAEAVLEIAAGTGVATARLRERLPAPVRLVASDLNDAMLDVARQRLGTRSGVEFRQADVMALPFSDKAFDAIVCQFGIMFFPDKPRAMREVARVLRPGGQFLFDVWGSLDENPPADLAIRILARRFPVDPPQFLRVPYGFHDIPAIRELLGGAGFVDIVVETVDRECVAGSAEHAALGLIRGNPGALEIAARDATAIDDLVAALAEALRSAHGDHPLRAPMRAHIVSARR